MSGNGSQRINLTIDGQAVEVAAGTNLIVAARQVGVHIPHYCYHPALTAPGNCRICQVEVEGQPKPVLGCRTPAQDGMVVHTASEKARAVQHAVQEFLLCNHPLDCPICDKSGECTLQNYYMAHGQHQPVMLENKYKKHKATPIGPRIVLDSERCILCTRCVRFCDEITGTRELGIFNRNNHAEIGVVPDTVLDNPYSGNLVNICPVGALGDRDFRFRCRVWYLQSTKSVCPGCAKGCNITVDHQTRRAHKADGARIMRLRPRFNAEVNGHWMCDDGRYDYRWHDENRLTRATVKQREVSVREAVEAVAAALKSSGAKSWAMVVSTHLTNEDLALAKHVAAALDVGAFFAAAPRQGEADTMLRRADKSPNTAGAKALGINVDDGAQLASLALKNVWALGFDVVGNRPGQAFETLIFQGTNICATSEAAEVVLPSATCFERDGTFTNEDGRVQRLNRAVAPLGDAAPDTALLRCLGEALGLALPAAEEVTS